MNQFRKCALMIIFISGSISYGSGAQPCTQFVSADGQSFLLGDAYKAADLVVIGEVTYSPNPILKIKNKIKGSEVKKEVQLTSIVCQGTACSGGFSVATNIDLFFLLKKFNGAYDSVSGNGNFACPVVFETGNNVVFFKEKKIAIRNLEKYLKSNPGPVPLR